MPYKRRRMFVSPASRDWLTTGIFLTSPRAIEFAPSALQARAHVRIARHGGVLPRGDEPHRAAGLPAPLLRQDTPHQGEPKCDQGCAPPV
eukprot:1180404-Prorocentrum_minimum.AAC.2